MSRLSLPRKVDAYISREQARDDSFNLYEKAKVHPVCTAIWQSGTAVGRQDTYIGLINTKEWIFYIAPCFGVDPRLLGATLVSAGPIWRINHPTDFKLDINHPAIMRNIAQGNFDGDVEVVSESTSTRDRTQVTRKEKMRIVEAAYGKSNACYTALDPDKGFDGTSHKALKEWITVHPRIEDNNAGTWWLDALGFAIQKDSLGYYIRFSSTLNEAPGQGAQSPDAKTFEARPIRMVKKTESTGFWPAWTWTGPTWTVEKEVPKHQDRETRDLPKQWALFTEQILARDLKLQIHPKINGKFTRMVSRDETQTTKFSRFTLNPDASHDLSSPGTVGTHNLLT